MSFLLYSYVPSRRHFFEVPGKVFLICHSFPLQKSISQSACSSSFTPLKPEVGRCWWNLGRLSLKIAASYRKWPGNDDVSSWDAKCAWKEEECDKSLEKIALFCLEAKIAQKRWPPFSFPFCPRKNGRSCLWSFSDSGATCKWGGGGYLWLTGGKKSQLRIPVFVKALYNLAAGLCNTEVLPVKFLHLSTFRIGTRTRHACLCNSWSRLHAPPLSPGLQYEDSQPGEWTMQSTVGLTRPALGDRTSLPTQWQTTHS